MDLRRAKVIRLEVGRDRRSWRHLREFSVALDQGGVRAAVFDFRFARGLKLRDDAMGEDLPQFDAPLTE